MELDLIRITSILNGAHTKEVYTTQGLTSKKIHSGKDQSIMQLKEPIDTLLDYWDGSPETDPSEVYMDYQNEHSNEYMHMVSSNDEDNNIDYDKGTITVDGEAYDENNMQLLHENNHVYLLVNKNKILIKWLDDYIGVPYI